MAHLITLTVSRQDYQNRAILHYTDWNKAEEIAYDLRRAGFIVEGLRFPPTSLDLPLDEAVQVVTMCIRR